jgi:hypothetical protein
LGEPFLCVLHAERRPSAALWRRDDGEHVRYHDLHTGNAGDPGAWLSLALVRARQAGRQRRLSESELTVWKLRLVREAGLLDIEQALEPVDVVHAGFLELCQLRRLVDGGQPAPFSARFAAAWCSVPLRTAHAATRELARRRLILPAGADSRGTPLWRPRTNPEGA